LRLAGYYQHRKFRSTFSSVNATRTVETPALNQFDVPADAGGGSAVWSMQLASQHALTFGFDARWVEGETNELFRFIGNDFTRLRRAGGEQIFLGAFAEDAWKISPAATVVGGIRIDRWQLSDASRLEVDRATGLPTLRQNFPERDGSSVNGRLGTTANLTSTLSMRAAAYTGFRVPTLNELYRPFRVGNAVTEANADLNPERLLGSEAGIEWRPVSQLRLGGTFFYNRLEDAIGNVTIGFGPGTFDPGGFIPAGGVLRQRKNIDLVTAPGVELSADWQPIESLHFRASYLWTQPTIDRASEADLVGRLLAQTPEHVVIAAAEWRPVHRFLITAQGRYSGRQFEDDLNTLPLAPFVTLDAAVFYDFNDKISAGVKGENLLDSEIETGKTPDGLVSTGAPRLVTLQLQCQL
jgi:outer membrane receptor protein involved in Fe transport